MNKQEAKEAIFEEMVLAQMQNTGEDRRTACMSVKKYICQHLYTQQQENN